MKPVALVLIALAVAAASGCGISTGQSDSTSAQPAPEAQEVDASGELETQIRQQLPAEAKRLTGSSAFVSDVGCVHSGGNAYQCIATLSSVSGYGRSESEKLPIEGTCDARQCIWKVSP